MGNDATALPMGHFPLGDVGRSPSERGPAEPIGLNTLLKVHRCAPYELKPVERRGVLLRSRIFLWHRRWASTTARDFSNLPGLVYYQHESAVEFRWR